MSSHSLMLWWCNRAENEHRNTGTFPSWMWSRWSSRGASWRKNSEPRQVVRTLVSCQRNATIWRCPVCPCRSSACRNIASDIATTETTETWRWRKAACVSSPSLVSQPSRVSSELQLEKGCPACLCSALAFEISSSAARACELWVRLTQRLRTKGREPGRCNVPRIRTWEIPWTLRNQMPPHFRFLRRGK